jgi:hypothetical protein
MHKGVATTSYHRIDTDNAAETHTLIGVATLLVTLAGNCTILLSHAMAFVSVADWDMAARQSVTLSETTSGYNLGWRILLGGLVVCGFGIGLKLGSEMIPQEGKGGAFAVVHRVCNSIHLPWLFVTAFVLPGILGGRQNLPPVIISLVLLPNIAMITGRPMIVAIHAMVLNVVMLYMSFVALVSNTGTFVAQNHPGVLYLWMQTTPVDAKDLSGTFFFLIVCSFVLAAWVGCSVSCVATAIAIDDDSGNDTRKSKVLMSAFGVVFVVTCITSLLPLRMLLPGTAPSSAGAWTFIEYLHVAQFCALLSTNTTLFYHNFFIVALPPTDKQPSTRKAGAEPPHEKHRRTYLFFAVAMVVAALIFQGATAVHPPVSSTDMCVYIFVFILLLLVSFSYDILIKK